MNVTVAKCYTDCLQ